MNQGWFVYIMDIRGCQSDERRIGGGSENIKSKITGERPEISFM